MKLSRKGKMLLGSAGLFALLVAGVFAYASIAGGQEIISAFDVLALPGESISLEAKLEGAGLWGFRPDISGGELVFRRDGEEAGRARTDDDGRAKLVLSRAAEGESLVKVARASEKLSSDASAELFIAVRTAETPMVIVDIDGTIADVSALKVIWKNARKNYTDIRPLPNAVEVMGKLASRFKILYLTHREEMFLPLTKTWLRELGFPRAPVFFSRFPEETWSGEKYKTERIRQLKARWPGIFLGIGDRVEDGKAYAANALEAYIIRDESDPDPTDRVRYVKGWSEIEEALLSD